MKTKILADFQICICVPLTRYINHYPKAFLMEFKLRALVMKEMLS